MNTDFFDITNHRDDILAGLEGASSNPDVVMQLTLYHIRKVLKTPGTLVNSAEAARILGVSRQGIDKLHKKEKLPTPIGYLGKSGNAEASPIWIRADIEALAKRRKSGNRS